LIKQYRPIRETTTRETTQQSNEFNRCESLLLETKRRYDLLVALRLNSTITFSSLFNTTVTRVTPDFAAMCPMKLDDQLFAGAMVALGQRKERRAYRRFELKKDVDKGVAQPQVGGGLGDTALRIGGLRAAEIRMSLKSSKQDKLL
jgi:hypothetical protein